MKTVLRVVMVGALACAAVMAQEKKAEESSGSNNSNPKLEVMPESLEVRWELSAAPPHLRQGATAYTLDPAKGYRVAQQGTNGVSCIVVRSDWQWGTLPFRDDVSWPVCYDGEGSQTHLRQYLDAAELRAKGMNSAQVHDEIMKRFDSGVYRQPAHAGVAYMIAPLMRGYPGGKKSSVPETNHLPHYMVYAPNVTDADIGGEPYSMYPFMLKMSPGHDDVIIFLVGEAEKAKILEESKSLLADLCSYRKYLCGGENGVGQHH